MNDSDKKRLAGNKQRAGSVEWIANKVCGSVGLFANETEAQAYVTRDLGILSAKNLEKLERCLRRACELPVTPEEPVALKAHRPPVEH